MIIIFDGPEKAGKTTLIKAVAKDFKHEGQVVNIRKWGPVYPDDRVYAAALQEDTAKINEIHLWDRSWAAESVYGYLLNRRRRLSKNWWLGDHLHANVVRPYGFLYMLHAHPLLLYQRRDKSDLDVPVIEELELFRAYANKFNWTLIDTTQRSLNYVVYEVISAANKLHQLYSFLPPAYTGYPNPKVLFVSKPTDPYYSIPGGWTPFTSEYHIHWAKQIRLNRPGFTDITNLKLSMLSNVHSVYCENKIIKKEVQKLLNILSSCVEVYCFNN